MTDMNTETHDGPAFRLCVAKQGLRTWLRVEITYPLPFSTEDANSFFGLDAQGCGVDRDYASSC